MQIAAQGGVSDELAAAAAGQESIDSVIADSTGAALASWIATIATPPTIVVPSDMLVEATDTGGATVNFAVTAFDVGGETLTPAVDHPSGSLFPLGITTVTATATDSLGDTGITQFTVDVVDTTPPTIALPANIVVEATSGNGAYVVVPQATATDPLDPNPTVAEDQSSGIFPLGVTTLNVTATDAAGNVSQGSFTITVQDTTPPVIAVPANLVVEANTTGGAVVGLPQVTATDAVDPNPIISEDQSSGFFPLGTTTVNITATDFSGNQSSSSYTVTVQDTTPPTINTPASLVVEANTIGGAQVTLSQATATDICDPNPRVTEDHTSGFFPLGTTTVNVMAADASGNESQSSFTVTVVDTTPPVLSLPANLTVEANTTGGALVTLPTATAVDICDPNPTVTQDQSSGFFPLGTTTVDVTATDASGNAATGAYTVTVVDTTPPTLTLPANLVVEANQAGGTQVTLPQATATDIADPNPLITYDQSSGLFPIGTTTVDVMASDASGNAASGSFNVTVQDTTPPLLTTPANIVVNADSPRVRRSSNLRSPRSRRRSEPGRYSGPGVGRLPHRHDNRQRDRQRPIRRDEQYELHGYRD